MNGARAFLIGFSTPWAGLQLILRRPRLRRLTGWLVLTLAILYIGGTIIAWPWIARLIAIVTDLSLEIVSVSSVSVAGLIVKVLLGVLLWPTFLALLLCLLFLSSQILAASFYARLVKLALTEYGVVSGAARAGGVRGWVSGGIITIGKGLVFLGLAIVLVILSFLPGLGLIASFGFWLWAAFDTVDICFDALEMSFAARWKFVLATFPAFCGLALAIGLGFFIPGLNLLLFPASVVGAGRILRLRQTEAWAD